jgi:hypothetical protein
LLSCVPVPQAATAATASATPAIQSRGLECFDHFTITLSS